MENTSAEAMWKNELGTLSNYLSTKNKGYQLFEEKHTKNKKVLSIKIYMMHIIYIYIFILHTHNLFLIFTHYTKSYDIFIYIS